MIVTFRNQDNEELRTAGLDAVPRQFETVQFRGDDYIVADVRWNLTPSDGTTDAVDVTVWVE